MILIKRENEGYIFNYMEVLKKLGALFVTILGKIKKLGALFVTILGKIKKLGAFFVTILGKIIKSLASFPVNCHYSPIPAQSSSVYFQHFNHSLPRRFTSLTPS